MPEDKKEYEVIQKVDILGAEQPEGSVLNLTEAEAAAAPEGTLKPFVRPSGSISKPLNEEAGQQNQGDGQKVYTLTAEQLKELISEATKPMQDKIGMLEAVADPTQLENWFRKNRKAQGMQVRLTLHGDKIVTGWSMFEDTVQQDINSGRFFEKQIMRIKLEDETTVDVPYTTFTNILRNKQITATVLEKTIVDTEDPDVKKFRFKLKRDDNGAELVIMDSFVN